MFTSKKYSNPESLFGLINTLTCQNFLSESGLILYFLSFSITKYTVKIVLLSTSSVTSYTKSVSFGIAP